MSYLKKIDDLFNEQLAVFKSEALSMLKNNLRMIDANVSGDLANSIDVVIHKRGKRWEIELSMNMYGRVLEKVKRFKFDRMNPRDLAEWVKAKGIQHFDYIPGYEKSGRIPDNAHERIAWGIIKSRKGQTNAPRTSTGKSIDVNAIFAISTKSNFSWMYKPYFGMWRAHKTNFMNIFYSTTSEELMDELVKTHKRALQEYGSTLGGVIN